MKKKYLPTDIFFSYKGGTTMKIVFELYKEIFETLNTYKDISDKFKRSDSDYSIFINPNITDKYGNNIFLEVYTDINKISLWCLSAIKNFIIDYENYIVPFNLINDEDIHQVIDKMNAKLADIKTNKEESYNYCYKFRGVDNIIGMSYFNKQSFLPGESIPAPLTKQQVDTRFININDESNPEETPQETPELLRQFELNGFVSTKRRNFYLTWNNEKNRRFLGMLNDKVDTRNNNDLYISINETNEYKAGDPVTSTNYTQFCLQRIKINFITYYKVRKDDGTFSYGYFSTPSELVDISIMKRNSIDLRKVYEHIDLEFRPYTFNEFNLPITYLSYSNYGHISDLCNILFHTFIYPWVAKKFEKRIARVLFFVYLDLMTVYNAHSFKQISSEINSELGKSIVFLDDEYKKNPLDIPIIKNTIKSYINNILTKITTLNKSFGTQTGAYVFFNNLKNLIDKFNLDTWDNIRKLLIQIYEYSNQIKLKHNNIEQILNAQKLKRLLAEQRRDTASISSGHSSNRSDISIDKLGGGNYYHKYLKYKAKYLQLKKQLGV